MRILFALHQFYPEFSGGTERVTLSLAQAAQRAGHIVHVIACTMQQFAPHQPVSTAHLQMQDAVHQGVPVSFLPRHMLPSAVDYSFESDSSLVDTLSAWLQKNEFDCVHVMHPMRMGSLILAAQRCKLPYLVTLTDFFSMCFLVNLVNLEKQVCLGPDFGKRCALDCLVDPWTHQSLGRRHEQGFGILSSASLRVCPSEYVAQRYRQEFPGLEFKVIPHGVNLLALLPKNPPSTLPQQNTRLTLGFIGSIVPQKGLDVLLRACAQIKSSSLRLLIAGEMHGDPTYLNQIRSLIKADPRVELLGRLAPSDVPKLLHDIDLLCLPSRVPESYSLILHEAAAARVPALVSALGAPGQHVTQHGGGICIASEDIDAWATAIAHLAENPLSIGDLRNKVTLPMRIEEEGFFYESLYRQIGLNREMVA